MLSKPARRAIACVGIVVFLGFYIWAATLVAERLPDHPMVRLAFYAVVGTAWGLPLFPLIAWSERGGRDRGSE